MQTLLTNVQRYPGNSLFSLCKCSHIVGVFEQSYERWETLDKPCLVTLSNFVFFSVTWKIQKKILQFFVKSKHNFPVYICLEVYTLPPDNFGSIILDVEAVNSI
jgi:hypothetical protein